VGFPSKLSSGKGSGSAPGDGTCRPVPQHSKHTACCNVTSDGGYPRFWEKPKVSSLLFLLKERVSVSIPLFLGVSWQSVVPFFCVNIFKRLCAGATQCFLNFCQARVHAPFGHTNTHIEQLLEVKWVGLYFIILFPMYICTYYSHFNNWVITLKSNLNPCSYHVNKFLR